ncbi:MAG: ATP-binding cassette domain-containing protein [Alphaproteobacteria bacterium]|nr:ATP-binding cassette domain-containing protein [Alphaproteobacteria bacterium]MCB9694059.1 ATP-binding cassette domain-containing protein [Alphaproteobacteria bacterium]
MAERVSEKSVQPAGEPVSYRRILALARPEIGVLSVATGALVISSGLTLVYPQAVAWMVDSIGGEPRPLPWVGVLTFDQMALGMLCLFAVASVFGAVRAWLFTIAGERIVARLRTDLYEAILGQEISFFDQSRTGELTNRLASDTTVLQNTVTVNISMALRFGASVLGGVAMLVYTSPRLAALALSIVPVVAIAASLYGRLIRRWSKDVQDALADATTVAEETFSGVRTVRAFAREKGEVARYREAVDRSYALAAKRALAMGVFNGFIGFAGYGSIAAVVWYGGRLVLDGRMSSGELTAFLLYTLMVAFSTSALANLFGDFMRASGASQRVFHLLDTVSAFEHGGEEIDRVSGDVRFDGVGFVYPSRPDVVVLDGFDLAVAPGRAVALVGPSGSGKSTVAQLLTRFYAPVSGRVLVDGRDIAELDGSSLRRHIGVVSQEPILFATSIRDNIRYGRPEAGDAEVRAAATAANALSFIETFPEGLDTMVGERGVRLSGGQKQRIAIARAILEDPAILILDEATSALDSESEHLVQEALDRLMEGRTTLIIAHRLSTVRDADEVVVLEGGRVVERGSHDELVTKAGLYRRLVERQFAS